MQLGFIGLGSQGAPMARRMIEAGYPVLLWARRSETLAPFSDTPAEIASSIGDLGARADHVGICVVDDAGVREICEALIRAMRPGSRIAVHSTVHPATCEELAKLADARGLSLIDAPVSGGAPAASVGALTVMVGGDADAVAAARPIFECFGKLILHLGQVGAGQKAKLINNALMTAHMGLAHHALAAATRLGLDRAVFVELVKASSGRSFGFETYARLPSPAAFSVGAPLLAKDVRLLGEVLGGDPSFAPLRDAAVPFLALAQNGAKKAT
jgi:3-hydroxyisobutyrate dehydrogenase-like beta-hydroxyacid dehydrogenase